MLSCAGSLTFRPSPKIVTNTRLQITARHLVVGQEFFEEDLLAAWAALFAALLPPPRRMVAVPHGGHRNQCRKSYLNRSPACPRFPFRTLGLSYSSSSVPSSCHPPGHTTSTLTTYDASFAKLNASFQGDAGCRHRCLELAPHALMLVFSFAHHQRDKHRSSVARHHQTKAARR